MTHHKLPPEPDDGTLPPRVPTGEGGTPLLLLHVAAFGLKDCDMPLCHVPTLRHSLVPLVGTRRRMCPACQERYAVPCRCRVCGEIVLLPPRIPLPGRASQVSACLRDGRDPSRHETLAATTTCADCASPRHVGVGSRHYRADDMGSWHATAYRRWEDTTSHLGD